MAFYYSIEVQPDWIDYNGHMRDAFYGLVYSFAVDSLQDEVGFDAAYREASGNTIYLLESHTYFLKETKLGDLLEVETQLTGLTDKVFQTHLTMRVRGDTVAVCEFVELHVTQKPEPHGTAMPRESYDALAVHLISEDAVEALPHRSRLMAPRRKELS